MFYDESIAGSWTALAARLNARCALNRWGITEPELAQFADVQALVAQLGGRVYVTRSDPVIGALVRLAAAEQDPDEDALLLGLHCLSTVALGLARDLGDLHHDILTLVVGELACQIRTYPWRRRTRAFAENLRLDTRRALLAELKPAFRYHPEWGEDVTRDGHVAQLIDGTVPGPDDEDDLDVADLLLWSVRAGVDAGGCACWSAPRSPGPTPAHGNAMREASTSRSPALTGSASGRSTAAGSGRWSRFVRSRSTTWLLSRERWSGRRTGIRKPSPQRQY